MAAPGIASGSWPYFDPDYETSGPRYNPPRVVVDNDALEDVTVVKVLGFLFFLFLEADTGVPS
jgi:hypothetical protein